MIGMSYVSSYFHTVFSTKERRPLITPHLRERLWPFLSGIARQNKMKALEVGGMEDQVHILLSLPSTLSLPRHFNSLRVALPNGYIGNQQEHHRKISFQEEHLALLKKHRIEYDERYLWD